MSRRRRRNPAAALHAGPSFNLDKILADGQKLAIVVGVGFGAYLLYQVWKGVEKTGKTAGNMYDQASEVFDRTADPEAKTFASWYDPTTRWVLFYLLTFPDGNQHIVWGHSVAVDGTFTYDGAPYRIGTDIAGGLRAYDNTPKNFGVTGNDW